MRNGGDIVVKRVLFQGDSITDAERYKENPEHLGNGYAFLVAAELGMENPERYEFINRGINGNRITDVYARIKKDIINLKPDVMSILIGVNDVWHELELETGVEAEKFYRIYSMLIKEIKEALPDVEIMILEPFVLKGTETTAEWEIFRKEVELRAEKSKEIAEKYQLTFIGLQKLFDEAAERSSSGYWLKDGVHPTAAGHELIKREWIKAFTGL